MTYDKKLHLAAGFLISLLVGYILHNPLYGFAMAVFAGFMKEFRDWCIYQGFDYKDMLATWAGGLLGTIVLGVAKWMF